MFGWASNVYLLLPLGLKAPQGMARPEFPHYGHLELLRGASTTLVNRLSAEEWQLPTGLCPTRQMMQTHGL